MLPKSPGKKFATRAGFLIKTHFKGEQQRFRGRKGHLRGGRLPPPLVESQHKLVVFDKIGNVS